MREKVRASTLIEVLIALVIIMVVFALAIRIFGNVLSSGVSLKKIQVQSQLDILAMEVKKQGYVETPHLQMDSVDYDFTIDTSARVGISQLTIAASVQGRVLARMKCLFKEMERHEEN
ncbi:type II secretion system protein [Pedobacter planticolens]|nr:prepilin-type N-terminal cleavage/methylation domain-containing protein [Pedobacter planticolens]